MLKKTLTVAAIALTALAGCSSSHKSSAPTTSSTALSSPTTAGSVPPGTGGSVTSASTPSTTTPSATTAPSGPQPCTAAALSADLGSPNGAAGTVYYDLTFTNKGTAICTLLGYPGVSFVTGSSGTQVGAAAARSTGTAAQITLAPGQSAAAPLGITVASNYGAGCQITPVTGLRVYPPGQTAALFVPHNDQGCANPADVVLHVGPLAVA